MSKKTLYNFIMEEELPIEKVRILMYINKHKKTNLTFEDIIDEINIDGKSFIKEITSFSYDEISYLGGEETNTSAERNLMKFKFFDTIININSPKKIKTNKTVKKDDLIANQAFEIYNLWKSLMKRRKPYNDKLKKRIVNCIKKSSYETCYNAVIGCTKSLHHMGYNYKNGEKNSKKYNTLENIFAKDNYVRLAMRANDPSIEDQIIQIKNGETGSVRNYSEELNKKHNDIGYVEL